MLSRKLLICCIGLFSLLGASFSFAGSPEVFRNNDFYRFGDFGYVIVRTNPVQANQPVYSWRSHSRNDGNSFHGFNGDLVGYTNNQGIYSVFLTIPPDHSLCGIYSNEQFAVGSRTAPRSNPKHFVIAGPILDFGPADPSC